MFRILMICAWMFSPFSVFASEQYLSDILLTRTALQQREELGVLLQDPEYEAKITKIFESRLESIEDLSNTNIDVLISHYADHAAQNPRFFDLCKIGFLKINALKDKDFLEKTMDEILFSPLALPLFVDIKDSFEAELRIEIEERIAAIEFSKEVEEKNLMEEFARMSLGELEAYLYNRLLGYPKCYEAVLVSLYMFELGFDVEAMTQESVEQALEKSKTFTDTNRTEQDFQKMAVFLKDFIASGKIKS